MREFITLRFERSIFRASDGPAMVHFDSARGYYPALCAAQIFDLSVDGQLVGFGFRSRRKAEGNALLYNTKRIGSWF